MDNNTYNLMNQAVEEMRSLWHIEKKYRADANGHPDEMHFWENMIRDKKAHIEELKDMIRKHLEAA